MNLVGANSNAEVVGVGMLGTRVHYLIGNDPDKWHTDVPTYARVKFRNIYPGVDLVYYGAHGNLEYDFVIEPGAEPERIRLQFEGADEILVAADGDLILRTFHGEFRHQIPQIYQQRRSGRHKIAGRYLVQGRDQVVFEIGEYDRNSALVIDPGLLYSTYLGGTGNDSATSIAIDSAGNAYVTGWTESLDVSTGTLAKFGTGGGVDAFVTKLNPNGTAVVYTTYLGGRGDDRGLGIGVDSSGVAVVAGSTYSSDFPIVAASQTSLAGGKNGFIAKLNAAGSGLLFSTYLGGAGYDSINGLALDSQRNIYVTGETTSPNFPTLNAVQGRSGGAQDAFVAKLSSTGVRQFSTYLGGIGDDRATAIAVDAAGNAYVTGGTYSPNFPVVNSMQPTTGGGQDAFVAKLNATGNVLMYSTYIGGAGGIPLLPEIGTGIAVDGMGYAYVSGETSSTNFPTTNAFQPSIGSVQDAFVLKLSPSGNALVYSSYLGGSSKDFATAIAVDGSGSAYVTGYTNSADYPVANSLQSSNHGSYDIFITKLNATGNGITLGTFVGGSGSDAANSIAVDAAGGIFLAGLTQSADFPVFGGIQPVKLGNMSAFALKIGMITYAISGQITVAGAGVGGITVSLSGAATASTRTDPSGNYSFAGLLPGGSYTITPSSTAYSFSPVSQSFVNLGANQTFSFVASAVGLNLAPGRTASQSSTLAPTTGADRALDGNVDGNYADGSITHTGLDANAWWQVDLGASAVITSIQIWNRTDCCGSRLSDYWIFVSDTPFASTDSPSTLFDAPGVWSGHQTAAPNPLTTVLLSSTRGRYVRVQLSGTNYLSLAEVRIFGTWVAGIAPPFGFNVAQGRRATQSSTLMSSASPDKAVDGNTDGSMGNNSVTHTAADTNAWWQVDLGNSAIISAIQIWNRTDCCASRLSDYWVFVSETPFASTDTPSTLAASGVWANHQTAPPNPSSALWLNGTRGRYIRVQLTGANYLSLAEVQVIGTWVGGVAPPAASNLALGRSTSQSSTLMTGAGPDKAVDGNADGNFSNGSVTHTGLNANAWWQVDLGASAYISYIQIWNRSDCCSSRLEDYYVFVSETPFAPNDTPSTLLARSGVWSSHQTIAPNPSATFALNGTRGRYVRVQLGGTNYLSLAEVQVIATWTSP